MSEEHLKIFLILCIIISHSVGEDKTRWRRGEQEEEGEEMQEGRIISSSAEFRLKEGETVIFPCHTVFQGSSVITWNWAGKLVSAGNVKVLGDQRVEVVRDGRELKIENIRVEDRGEVSCTLNLKSNPQHLNHTLQILVPPRAHIIGDKTLNLTEGERLELSCTVHGYPVPTVHWSKQGPGSSISTGTTLVVHEVKEDDTGLYTCTARSSEGQSTDTVSVLILYKPIIKLQRKFQREKTEKIFSLACSVDANPPAKVTWYKDGKYLKTENLKEGSEQQHFFSVTSLKESDYGNYTCEARNKIGLASQSLELKGQPDQPVILSNIQSYAETEYTLSWRVWTPPTLPILNQSILYRLKSKANGEKVGESEGTWHNLALISDTGAQQGVEKDEYKMDLTGLLSDAEYEVRIRAMNKQGWSQLSQPFFFKTSGSVFQLEIPLFTKRQLTSQGNCLISSKYIFSLFLFLAKNNVIFSD
ncbi:protein amalgam [Eurytemora carolleeae]|uniref:protein amalgam n=1 Tax=Eurytemora carolleeae TaxID=1294199 RepID=UPI000C7774C9|nr:protein amalgam [Eurytemora carolleeae]|eukprot:XP_023328691.1 protein amalgam-like [Eurytemora affinis]